jgi:hypothetical protein
MFDGTHDTNKECFKRSNLVKEWQDVSGWFVTCSLRIILVRTTLCLQTRVVSVEGCRLRGPRVRVGVCVAAEADPDIFELIAQCCPQITTSTLRQLTPAVEYAGRFAGYSVDDGWMDSLLSDESGAEWTDRDSEPAGPKPHPASFSASPAYACQQNGPRGLPHTCTPATVPPTTTLNIT